MPNDPKALQNIFFLRASTDVVNDQRRPRRGGSVRNESNVSDALAKIPRDDISGGEVFWLRTEGPCITMALKVGH